MPLSRLRCDGPTGACIFLILATGCATPPVAKTAELPENPPPLHERVGPPSPPPLVPPKEDGSRLEVRTLASGEKFSIQRVELIRPFPAPRVEESRLSKTLVAVQCQNGANCAEASDETTRSYLQLDDHGPRSGALRRPISELLPEDQEIAPGRHLLSAFVITNDRVYFDSVPFSSVADGGHDGITTKDAAAASSVWSERESCRLVLPRLTENGPTAGELVFLGLFDSPPDSDAQASSTGVAPVQLSYQVNGSGWMASGTFPLGTSAVLSDVPGGDIEVKFTCIVADRTVGQGRRTITVNPELAPPKAP